MLQRIDIPCPSCRNSRLVMDIAINDQGSQSFTNGEIQKVVACESCGAQALVTLQGAGSEPTAVALPERPEQHQEGRGHSTHR
jgi:hypothetical protein